MIFDRVEQTTTTTGTGTLSLIAPTDASRRSYVEAAGSGGRGWYCIETLDQTQYEYGWGVVTAGTPDTLTRNPILSTNSNALVNFPAGTKRVYCTLPATMASRIVNVQSYTDAGSTTTSTTLVNVNAANFLYTPKSPNSTLHLLCQFQAASAAVTGGNSQATYVLAEGSTGIGTEYSLAAFASAGGLGVRSPVLVTATISNSSTVTRTFNLRGANTGATPSSAVANYINLIIIERTV